jgi:hypothetical protein
MESKICTYSEPNIRLQLVKIDNNTGDLTCEIRLNRSVIYRVSRSQFTFHGTLARLMFLHYVHEICMNRNLTNLSHLTL